MNISIRWKLMGAFLISMILPVLFIKLGLSLVLSLVLSALVVTPLFLYSSYRILSTIHGLRDKISQMTPSEERRRRNQDFSKDELSAALLWTDELVKDLESRFEKKLDQPEKEKALPSEGEHLIKCTYGTGLPTKGVIAHFNHNLDNLTLMPDTHGHKGADLFERAIDMTRIQLQDMRQYLSRDEDRAGIIDFQIYFLEDNNFLKGVKTALFQGESLKTSLDRVFDDFTDRLSSTDNSYIRNRISDLFDLKKLIYESALVDSGAELASAAVFKDKIVYCQEVYPSDVIHLHRCGIKGFIIIEGTPSSHAQILLESLNVPSVSGMPTSYELQKDLFVAINPIKHELVIRPESSTIDRFHALKERFSEIEIIREVVKVSQAEEVQISATLNMAEGADQALRYGADSVGLFRSEFAYIGRNELPKEEELVQSYRDMLNVFKDRSVVMRMLDVGGDKLTWFHSQQGEENPSMGNRSMRFLLKHQSVFRTQARAMLKTANDKTAIIYPMVGGIDELEMIESCMNRYADELRSEVELCEKINYGIMVEVPSVVERFEDYVDRFSHFNLGTNDLVQYTLAADRNNRDVREFYSHLHPSILLMIQKVSDLCHERQKVLCLCGQSAAELDLLPLWVGLGLRQFSLSPSLIPLFKHHVKSLDLEDCQNLAKNVLQKNSIQKIKQEIQNFIGSKLPAV